MRRRHDPLVVFFNLAVAGLVVLGLVSGMTGRTDGSDPLAATPPAAPDADPTVGQADPSGDEAGRSPSPGPARTPSPTSSPTTPPAVLVGAGDIAMCSRNDDEATARLLDAIPGTVFTAGDNAYADGTRREYAECYDPSWGRHRDRTLPAPGNHDYETRDAAGYLDYFGDAARPDGTTWYATDVGAWRVIVLDSTCSRVDGGCGRGSPQLRWLERELATDPRACTLAIWHHATFSSGLHGSSPATRTFWAALEDVGAEFVVTAHDHDYERFAPQTVQGRADREGIREFVVGTGGGDLRRFRDVQPNSEVRESGTHGVLKLTLREGGYDWAFVPVAGRSFSDSGSGDCH